MEHVALDPEGAVERMTVASRAEMISNKPTRPALVYRSISAKAQMDVAVGRPSRGMKGDPSNGLRTSKAGKHATQSTLTLDWQRDPRKEMHADLTQTVLSSA